MQENMLHQGCKLYYNDYNEYWDHKRDCMVAMCTSLYNKGLLDGVGKTSHTLMLI